MVIIVCGLDFRRGCGSRGLLKTEMYHGTEFTSTDQLITEIDDYIHWYNTERISIRHEGLSPVQYRAQTLAA